MLCRIIALNHPITKKFESLMSFKVDALPPGVNVGFYFTTTAFPIYAEWFSKKNQYIFFSS